MNSENVDNDDCSAGSTNCTITCTNCPSSINCPTTDLCQECIVNCTAQDACRDSSIYGHSCDNVIVNCESDGKQAGEGATIYAPDESGNLTVNVITGDNCFKGVTVIAPENGGSIDINCADTDDNDEWYL